MVDDKRSTQTLSFDYITFIQNSDLNITSAEKKKTISVVLKELFKISYQNSHQHLMINTSPQQVSFILSTWPPPPPQAVVNSSSHWCIFSPVLKSFRNRTGLLPYREKQWDSLATEHYDGGLCALCGRWGLPS